MLDFKNQSFEDPRLKTWKSWTLYDISYDGIYWVSNDTLDDKIKSDEELIPEAFNLLSDADKNIRYKKYRASFWNLELHGLSQDQLIDILSNETYSVTGLEKFSLQWLRDKLNQELLRIHHIDNFDFFLITDPRRQVLTKAEEKKYSKENFPKNIVNLLTHGTYAIPAEIKWQIKADLKNRLSQVHRNLDEAKNELYRKNFNFLRILKHFSDFGTRYVIKYSLIPSEQIIAATNSRSLVDPARKAWTEVMKTDFYGNNLPEALGEWIQIGEAKHLIYHLEIDKKIDKTIASEEWTIVIDNHDTGIVDMWESIESDKYDDGWFSLITLWTKDGASCNKEIVEYYTQRIKYHLWIDVLINSPYKGWYVTEKHGVEKRNTIQAKWGNPWVANVIQQEVGKFLYLDERTQKVDHDKAELIWIGLARAQADLGEKFWKKYFEAINKSEEDVEKYLEEYQEAA